ncbi:IS1634 family transposase [Alicyclobacillus cycloheptanicus]|nr:IS1634 family transposase [Alicyclobacillus cycloheptanicus]WDM03020.1 IS1634 family transposase [Alicyclobacillus cycloheptanicus]
MRPLVMGASALWSRLIDQFGWVEMIDKQADRDGDRLSVGTRLKALLINIGTDRKALYKVQEFYEKRDVEVLLGAGVSATDLNDDALGRALDILYDMGLDALYPKLALKTVNQLKVMDHFDDLLPVHSDTTSVSLYGEYAQQDDAPESSEDNFAVARGYSKDHRPDLKQIIFGQCTLRGVTLCANVDKGNQDDHTWNNENITRLAGLLEEQTDKELLYVADSAVVTEENLKLLADEGIHFVSRLPSNFKLCQELKRSAWEKEKAWRDVGQIAAADDASTYKIQSFRRELYGRTYRLIAVRSTGLAKQKEHKLEDVLQREKTALEKAVEKAQKVTYSCAEDAEAAAKALVHQHRKALHRLQITVDTEQIQEKRARRGRPRKDESAPGVRTVYRLNVKIASPDEQTLQLWRERESTFVLITDIRDDQRVADERVLRLYKDQIEVENRFRYLKSPYHVGPVFLQKPSRVKAFGYVMLMSLLMYSAFEYILREQMAKETEPLILPGKRKSFRPTGISVLEMFDEMTTIWIESGDGRQRMTARPHDPQIERILAFFGMDLNIYSEVASSGC